MASLDTHPIPLQYQACKLAQKLAVTFVAEMMPSHDMNAIVNGLEVWKHCMRKSVIYATYWADCVDSKPGDEKE